MAEDHVASAEVVRKLSLPARGARPLPLNSKRLISVYLHSIARAMELPTGGSVAETRQMIEGKLGGEGREPTNVQVLVQTDGDGAEFVSLTDISGVFLGPEPVRPSRGEASGGNETMTQGKSEGDSADHGSTPDLEEAL